MEFKIDALHANTTFCIARAKGEHCFACDSVHKVGIG